MRLQVTEAMRIKVSTKCCLSTHRLVSVARRYIDGRTLLHVKYETLTLL